MAEDSRSSERLTEADLLVGGDPDKAVPEVSGYYVENAQGDRTPVRLVWIGGTVPSEAP